MRTLLRHLPNALTCISLSFGFYATVLAFTGDFHAAMTAILLAAAFDFADGLAARLLKAYSDMGKELDSLADMVSFGVAPGAMLFFFLHKLMLLLSPDSSACRLLLLTAFAIPVCSALRLAKFNIDSRQKQSFIGLPVPAHAILWSSLITAFSPIVAGNHWVYTGLLPSDFFLRLSPEILLILLPSAAIAASLLLVSKIPMFSLKMSSLAWKANKRQYVLIISTILLTVLAGVPGIAATILLYILISVLTSGHARPTES
jgi:CDP-diacylglycerol--serine O-phosphatidyltransferase